MTMVKPAALTQLLSNANTGGVLGSLLLNPEGSLLAFSGPADRDARVTASLASNVWAGYCPASPDRPPDRTSEQPSLRAVLLQCEEGRVCVAPCGPLLVCVYSDTSVGFGLLKAKTLALAQALATPLQRVACA